MATKAIVVNKSGDVEHILKHPGSLGYQNGSKDLYEIPESPEIIHFRKGLAKYVLGSVAIYTRGVPRPWPVAGAKQPRGLTTEDNMTQKGKFLANTVRDAIQDDDKFSLMLFIAIGVGVVGLIAAGIAGYEAYQTHQLLQQIAGR